VDDRYLDTLASLKFVVSLCLKSGRRKRVHLGSSLAVAR
jgi:hypothetical protein